ncbi:MAG TPA: glycosyl hydrolase [Bacteroidales bacterium]|nr:glycosyl hydrolase [Bacteroidales bacterium]
MIEAVNFWNEPNNKSHWDFEVDPGWKIYSSMVKLAANAARTEKPGILRVLGGLSPIDPGFLNLLSDEGALNDLDAVAIHGFPLDWNLWSINEWPDKITEIKTVTDLPVWITEVGVSSFGAEEVQEFGLLRTAELLSGKSDRIHWYSLFDLPKTWEATTRHREAEGSSYYRHFYMGLLREDGTPKLALKHFAGLTPEIGLCQWFHFEDPRLDSAVKWLKKLNVKKLRTGLSWSDYLRPDAKRWFDRLMKSLEPFDVTATFCFTPESKGIMPHHTSAPRNIDEFADFCVTMMRKYA